MLYKYELHLHSSGCSACSKSTAIQMVQAAREQGFAGVVMTNHFYYGNTGVDRSLPWPEFVAAFEKEYAVAKAYGDAIGMDVLFGVEEGYAPGKESLIFGLSPQQFAAEPRIPHMTLTELSHFVHQNGGLIACAHPFRKRDYIPNPDLEPDPTLFDLVEVENYFNTPDRNQMAVEYAKRVGLPAISGGDVHFAKDVGVGGVAFPHRISNNQALVEALRAGNYRLIVNGKIV